MKSVLIKKSKSGKGMFANKNFTANEIILHIKGKLISCDEDEKLEDKIRDNTYRFSEDLFLSPKGEVADYINHSCEPNSCIRKKDDKLYCVAVRDIKKGEEISFDYSTVIADDDSWVMPDVCICGSKKCRKKIGKFSKLPKKVRDQYIKIDMVPNYIYDK